MKNSELNGLLQRARVPERSAQGWSELARDTMREIGRGVVPASKHDVTSTGSSARRPPLAITQLAWTLGFATACLFIVFLLGHWQSGRDKTRNELAEARKLFIELNAMFPNQLEAVTLNGLTRQLIVAEKPMANQGAPLLVRICGPRGCQRLITFSGRHLQMNGEDCEVLVDGSGRIIVTGETFAWSSTDAVSRAGRYRIQATSLSEAL